MPVPPLRADGTLPPGVYQASLDDVYVAYPASTARRVALNSALTYCVETIQRLALADHIALDGSYIMSKTDPSDIDLVVLTPGMYQSIGR